MLKTLKNKHVAFGPVPKELHKFFNNLFDQIEDIEEEDDEEMDEDDDCECEELELPQELIFNIVMDHEIRIHELEKALKKANSRLVLKDL